MAIHPDKSNLLRLRQVQEIVPYSTSSIYHMIAHGAFPAPIKLGPRASAWLESEVLEWVEERIEQREVAGVAK
jgi:prophage regulatory protein